MRADLYKALLFAVLAALAGVGMAAASGVLISRAALRPEVFMSLTLLVTTVRALGLGRALLRYAERLSGHAAALKWGEQARVTLFDRVSRFGRDLLALERSGDLLARAHADADARMMATLRVNFPLVAFAGVWLALSSVLLAQDVLLALLVGGPLLLAALGVWWTAPALHRLTLERVTLTRDHASRLLDALAASGDGLGGWAGQTLNEQTAQLEKVTRKEANLNAVLTALREGMLLCVTLGLLWRGLTLLDAGSLSGVWLTGLTLASIAAFDSVNALAALPAARTAALEAQRRDNELKDVTPQVTPPSSPVTFPSGPLSWTLQSVGLERAGKTVLKDVNLTLRTGERVALTGPSGAGKTTLARLLSRDLDPSAGTVRVNGVPLRELSLSDLRAHLSLHEQDAPLLDGTVAENLRLAAPQVSDERLRTLLDDLGLQHLNLPDWIGEGGTRLSGGERARLSLARALLKPAALLILDEPTAHLDAQTEQLVLHTIERELAGRTLLLLTHRQAPLALTRRVLTLNHTALQEVPPLRERIAV